MREGQLKVSILGSRGIPAGYGAFEVCAYRVGLGLVQKGCEVTVYCPKDQAYQEDEYQGIRLEFVPHPKGPVGALLYDILSLLKACFQGSDVILLLGYSASPFCLFPRLLGKKVVINTDGLEWKRSKWGRIPKLWLRLTEKVAPWIANRLVSDSVTIAQYYWDKYKTESTFIPYGTEFPDLEDLPNPNLSNYYIVVMRLEPENSILEIVEGFHRSGIEKDLLIVGSSTPFFQERVLPLVEEDYRIQYLGPVYDREKLFILRTEAFGYIHGHTVGGTNPSLLEGMACRNLVVARDVSFNREVLGEGGFYFSSGDHLGAILEAMEEILPEDLDQVRDNTYLRVRSLYTWESVVEGYYDLFSEVSGCP